MAKPIMYFGSMPERYRPLARGLKIAALELAHSEEGYVYGGESPEGSDCSGTLAYPLTRCGHPMRLTAAEFYNGIFIHRSRAGAKNMDAVDFPVLFVIADKEFRYPNGVVRKAGESIHVAPFVGRGVVLDADYVRDEVAPITVSEFFDTYQAPATYIEVAYPSLTAIVAHEGMGLQYLDPRILDYTR